MLYACVGVRSAPILTPAKLAATSKRAGMSDQTAAAAAGVGAAKVVQPYTASGDWVIARSPFTEVQRRLLLRLSEQHLVWCDDTSKFIAKYGDYLCTDSDLEGTDSAVCRPTQVLSSGPSISSSPAYIEEKCRSEAALESRLESLLKDMEGIVDQVLGQSSECAMFLRRRFQTAASFKRPGEQATSECITLCKCVYVHAHFQEMYTSECVCVYVCMCKCVGRVHTVLFSLNLCMCVRVYVLLYIYISICVYVCKWVIEVLNFASMPSHGQCGTSHSSEGYHIFLILILVLILFLLLILILFLLLFYILDHIKRR